MAPKLPPPANTKAVFAGPAWSDTDKVLLAPAVDALTKSHATFGWVYSSGERGCAINIGCGVATVIPRRAPSISTSSPRKRGPITTNVYCCGRAAAPAVATHALVVVGPGSRSLVRDDLDQRSTNAFSITKWPASLLMPSAKPP